MVHFEWGTAMNWQPHTSKPEQLKPILIARQDRYAPHPWVLVYGIFFINDDGHLVDENTHVHKAHFDEYMWCYESDVLETVKDAATIEDWVKRFKSYHVFEYSKPNPLQKIIRVINRIRESHPDQEWLYMNGRCYQFALILREMFMDQHDVEIFYSAGEGHVYTRIDDLFFDIRGRHFKAPSDAIPISAEPKQYGRADRWKSGDRRRLIDLTINNTGVSLDEYKAAATNFYTGVTTK